MLAMALSLAGCATLEPKLPTSDAQLIDAWPLPPDAAQADASVPVKDVGWRDFFTDSRLQQAIALALENNRDLRIATLNVERAQAQYRIQRADRVPSLSVDASLTRTGGDVTLSFPSATGFTYHVEYKTALNTPAWTPLTTRAGNGSIQTVNDLNPGGQTRYYRLRVE